MLRVDSSSEGPLSRRALWASLLLLASVLILAFLLALNGYCPVKTFRPFSDRTSFARDVVVYRNVFGMRYAVVRIEVYSHYYLTRGAGRKVVMHSAFPDRYFAHVALSEFEHDPAEGYKNPIPIRTYVLAREGQELQRMSR